MKMNKLKAISIAVCCLISSLWSETQSMDNQPDILESATVNHTANMQSSSQNEIDALDLVSKSSQLINLEDSQNSWASYLISPVKTATQIAHEAITYTKMNPMMTILIFINTFLVPAVNAYNCYCTNGDWKADLYKEVAACYDDCQHYCRENFRVTKFYRCI